MSSAGSLTPRLGSYGSQDVRELLVAWKDEGVFGQLSRLKLGDREQAGYDQEQAAQQGSVSSVAPPEVRPHAARECPCDQHEQQQKQQGIREAAEPVEAADVEAE